MAKVNKHHLALGLAFVLPLLTEMWKQRNVSLLRTQARTHRNPQARSAESVAVVSDNRAWWGGMGRGGEAVTHHCPANLLFCRNLAHCGQRVPFCKRSSNSKLLDGVSSFVHVGDF